MASTWILVADAARARLFEPAPTDGRLVEIECFTNPEGRAGARQMDAHHPPTVNESAGAGRYDVEPHQSARDRTANRFAHALSEALERGRTRRRYERLVLVAPPRFLGALHQHLSEPLRNSIAGELRRDLTTLGPTDLRARLPQRLLPRKRLAGAAT